MVLSHRSFSHFHILLLLQGRFFGDIVINAWSENIWRNLVNLLWQKLLTTETFFNSSINTSNITFSLGGVFKNSGKHLILELFAKTVTAWKVSKHGVFSGLYFPSFALNMKIYGVNLRIRSECGKMRSRKISASVRFTQRVTSI